MARTVTKVRKKDCVYANTDSKMSKPPKPSQEASDNRYWSKRVSFKPVRIN